MPHPLGVIVDDILNLGELLPHLQDFIDLLLIFRQDQLGVGVIDDILNFRGDSVLINRHRHATESFGCHQRPVQLRAIVTDDGKLIIALKAEVGEAESEIPDLRQVFGPAVGLPDAIRFLPHGHFAMAVPPCIRHQ